MFKLVKIVAQRLALGVFVLFVISVIIAGGVELLPGDICQELQGQAATEETVNACRRELGLDKPVYHRYFVWLGQILPAFDGKILTSALNVPVQEGCLLDVNLVMADSSVEVAAVNDAMRAAAEKNPGIIGVVEDPIVSSDVIGSSLSLLFDTKGTIKAGANTIKTLSWYENLGHAARLLDVVRLYNTLDQQREAA